MSTDRKNTTDRRQADPRTHSEKALDLIADRLRDVVLELRVGRIPDTLAEIRDRLAERVEAGVAAHHECACGREHADEWVEVDEDTWDDLPDGTRLRREWTKGRWEDTSRHFVHRDDLPDDPRALIARELGAVWAEAFLGLLDEHGWTVTRKEER